MFKCYLAETVTGQVGKRLGLTALTYRMPINDIGSGSVTVRKADLTNIPRKRFDPDFATVLLTYTYEGVESAFFAGPITGWAKETDEDLTIDFSDIRGIFENRLALRDGAVGRKESTRFKGLSLGTIAQDVVSIAQDRLQGDLPVVFGTPRETETDGAMNVRNYEWYNVANINTHEVLEKLSNVINGPDIMFRVEFTDDTKSHIQWRMYNGTKAQPSIAQDRVMNLDATSARNGIVSWEAITNAKQKVSRVYVTGSGQDEGTLIGQVDDTTELLKGYPFRETVLSDGSEENLSELKKAGEEHLRANLNVKRELSMVIRADHQAHPLPYWHVGDRAHVTLKDSLSIPNGTHEMIIIEASGNQSNEVTIKLQEVA